MFNCKTGSFCVFVLHEIWVLGTRIASRELVKKLNLESKASYGHVVRKHGCVVDMRWNLGDYFKPHRICAKHRGARHCAAMAYGLIHD